MRVILLVNVPKVGNAGELVEVKEGFARNYLLPKKLAEVASGQAAAKILLEYQKKQEENQKHHSDIEKEIRALDGKNIVYKVKVNEQGHPYKAITEKDIVKSLNIDDKMVAGNSFKSTGFFTAKVKFGKVVSRVTIEILPEK